MSVISEFRRLFNRRQKRRYAVLQGLFLLAALVQVVSVGSIAPFIAVLSQPKLIHTHVALSWLYRTGEFTSEQGFLVSFAILLMMLTVIGNFVPAVMGYLSWSFVRQLALDIQSDVYRGFMYGDLARTARLSSAQRINIVTQGVNRLIYNVVLPMLALVSNGLVIVLIAFGLLIYDPIVALVAGVIVGGGYFVIFAFSKRRLSRHGSIAWASFQSKQRLMAESLSGLKEVRLAGTAWQYEARLHDLTSRALLSEAKVGLYGDLPRFALEAIAFCSLLLLGIFLLLRNSSWAGIVAVLSVYAMAGYRLLPAAQSVFRSVATLRANLDVVSEITLDVEAGRSILQILAPPVTTFSTTEPIVFDAVCFRYPGEPSDVVQGLSFVIERNSLTAFVGKSGAGKSTLADLLLGLLRPSAGTISVAGTDIHQASESWFRSVSLVSQSVFLIDDSIEANIVFGSPGPVDRERLKRAAVLAHADGFISELPGGYECPIGEAGGRLSGGQRQRIGIARALYNDADVIVLDEPTSALDTLAEREVLAAIDSLRKYKTIILITHRLHTLKDADQIIMLEGGQLVGAGTFEWLSRECSPFRTLLATH